MEETLELVVGDVLRMGGAATLCAVLDKALQAREHEIASRGEGWCPGQLLAVNAVRTAILLTGRELGMRMQGSGAKA